MTKVLIIGCGYLGQALAHRLLAAGVELHVTTRRPPGLARLARLGATVHTLDLAAAALPAVLATLPVTEFDHLYYLVPPGPEPAYTLQRGPEQLVALLAAARRSPRVVVSSSTAVYGDRCGDVVTAETEARPDDERGLRLLAAEERWLAFPGSRVVRLAGIYGPLRIIGRQDIEAGLPVAGDPDRWLNLVYQDDAAALLERAALSDATARIELGADGHPVTRREYYGAVAAALGQAAPAFTGAAGTGRGARTASRRCDSGSTRERLGWTPVATSYVEGLQLALRAEAASRG
jgi:nucleoside-diphosphate-sugar epimerase